MFTELKTKHIGEAIYKAGHGFKVETQPLYLPSGTLVPNKVATVRADTGQYLGTVGKDYKVVQPFDFYSLADAFMKQTGATIDKAITMKNGAVMGLSFDLGSKEYLPGDRIDMAFLIMTSFNMQYSIMGKALSTRLFCLNQLPHSNRLFDVKHSTYAYERLGVAMKMVAHFGKEQKIFDAEMKMLIDYKMSGHSMVNFFRSLFPVPRADSKIANTNLENNIGTFVRLLDDGRGANEVPGLKGTGYHCLNAITEFANHEKKTRVREGRNPDEIKFESLTFGNKADFMINSKNRLIEMVKHEPSGRYVSA